VSRAGCLGNTTRPVDFYSKLNEDEVGTAEFVYCDRHHDGLAERGTRVQETSGTDVALLRPSIHDHSVSSSEQPR